MRIFHHLSVFDTIATNVDKVEIPKIIQKAMGHQNRELVIESSSRKSY